MVSGARLLLVGAEPREFAGLVKFCRNVKALRWPVHWARSVELNGGDAWLVANGAGSARAARAADVARAAGKVVLVCSVGFCGALEPGLKAGDVFVAGSVRGAGREYAALAPLANSPHRSGVLVSIDHVAQTAAEKATLRASGASAVDMEAVGVAARAEELGVPFYCMRSITDLAEESFKLDLNAALRSDGRFGTMRLIAASCRRPLSCLPELLRLGRRARMASRTLGEFVADCRF